MKNVVTFHSSVMTDFVKKSEKVCRDNLQLFRDTTKTEDNLKFFTTLDRSFTTKDKADGNKTLSRHPKLYRDKEYKEALEIMS